MTEETTDGQRDNLSRPREERVRTAARCLRDPCPASWVAEETDVSVKVAQKYLDHLVDVDILRKIEHDEQPLYCIDQLMASYREVAALQREYDREEPTFAFESMHSQIADWKERYRVETPGELRASSAGLEETTEVEQRREIASEWEQIVDRLSIAQAARNEYDLTTKNDILSI